MKLSLRAVSSPGVPPQSTGLGQKRESMLAKAVGGEGEDREGVGGK